MGKIYKRGGTYYADYFDRHGRRQQKSTRTCDRVVAKEKLRDLELATTNRGAHSTQTLDDALTYFVAIGCAAKPDATRSCYEQKARHLSRVMGSLKLSEFDQRPGREHVDRYIAQRLKDEGAAKHSVHKELVVLRGALKSAQERGLGATLVDSVPPFSADYVPRDVHLSPEQFMLLTEQLVAPLPPNPSAATIAVWQQRKTRRTLYCLLIAFTSARRGELAQLRWEDIDLHRGVIRIPKGKTVKRDVKISPVLRPWLEALDAGTGPVTEPWGNVGRDLPDACARAGVPRCTPNDLRRTFATWLVNEDVPLQQVAKLMGHKSTRMVDLVYGHLTNETLDRAIDRLPGGAGDCNAGVTDKAPNRGEHGAHGTVATAPPGREKPSISEGDEGRAVVPRPRVELGTRGFSVRCSTN